MPSSGAVCDILTDVMSNKPAEDTSFLGCNVNPSGVDGMLSERSVSMSKTN